MTDSCRPLRIVLADDEVIFRASLRQLLTLPPSVIQDVYRVDVGPGFEIVAEADPSVAQIVQHQQQATGHAPRTAAVPAVQVEASR